jgi:Uma2 family endonuclease
VAAPANRRATAEEYLNIERQAPFKSEYLDGVVWAMAEASPNHVRIVANAMLAIGPAIKRNGCSVFASDLKVGQEGSAYFYPDLSIACGEPEFVTSNEDVLANPTVIVEVLSPSTEALDRGAKFHAYRKLDSLKQYLLVSQSSQTVDILSRRESVWVIETVTAGELRLDSLDITIPINDLYDQVTLPE